ncbi:hypothetical protein HGG82_15570 [Marinomonas sp. M1K-6]|uniref:Tetratricopeptide repeat protein n=1 Tax=Marinomonas profundi TaxID=2726122 RepID=A0A847R4U5_9GAMM|nr:tetratricopeptide repeat protein [Marinomonas profundi]NLQ19025.1 hypothetical protein [Marinomonas profundi]UDV02062.1 hypothetical protein J8N69_10670 [Marinomonas profundi]
MNLVLGKYMPCHLGAISPRSQSKPRIKGFLALLAILSLPLLNACSPHPTQVQTATWLSDAQRPVSPLKNDHISALLKAEFTLQREGPNKAFEAFYDLASQSNDITLIKRLGFIAVASQNNDFIEKSANLWLSVRPASEPAYALKWQVLIKEKRTEEAATLLTNAIRQNVPLHFLPRYLEDNVRDSEQISAIQDVIAMLPPSTSDDPHIQLSQAHILLLSGDNEGAIATAQAWLAQHDGEKSTVPYLILAFSQRNIGQLDDAIATLQTANARLPKDINLITPLIDFLIENEQSTKAIELYDTIRLEMPEALQIGVNLMQTLLEYKQPQQALDTANHLEAQFSQSDQVSYLTAVALYQLNNKHDAITTMNQVDGVLQANATNQIALWMYEDNKANAINDMVIRRTPREIMPEQVAIIGRLHEENGNIELFYALLNQALEAFPESAILRYRKALLADSLGDWAVTETELKTLLSKDPDNPQYLNALGYTLLTRTERIDEAMSYIESAYEKTDDDPAIIDSLGWGFFLKGELEQSSYYLKKAWSILPDAEIAAHYGESLWQQRHYEAAIEIWRTALETSPATPVLLDTIKRLSPSLLEEFKQDEPS